MFCSVIIPTIGRPSLNAAVQSALDQVIAGGGHEIIVVNDSGQPLPEADWQSSPLVQIVATQRRDRCVARNTGAAVATGAYFCFLDDDDWLLPGALHNFWEFIQESEGNLWFYGGVQFVDYDNNILGYLNFGKTGNCFVEAVAEIWIPIQASLIEADAFFRVGCFDPHFPIVEDLDLLRRLSFVGNMASMPVNVAVIRRKIEQGSAIKTGSALSFIRWGRDCVLEQPGAFPRLKDSAGSSPFLHGLILRIYASAMLYNFRRRNWLKTISRSLFLLISLVVSFVYLFSPEYWRAARYSKPIHHDLIENSSPDFDSVAEWIN